MGEAGRTVACITRVAVEVYVVVAVRDPATRSEAAAQIRMRPVHSCTVRSAVGMRQGCLQRANWRG